MSLISFPVRDQIWSTIVNLAGFVTDRDNSWRSHPSITEPSPSEDLAVLKVVSALGDACAALGRYDIEKTGQSDECSPSDLPDSPAHKPIYRDPVDRISNHNEALLFVHKFRGLHRNPDSVDRDLYDYIDGSFDVLKRQLGERVQALLLNYRNNIAGLDKPHDNPSRAKYAYATETRLVDVLSDVRENPARERSFLDDIVTNFTEGLHSALVNGEMDAPNEKEVFWSHVEVYPASGVHDDFRTLLYSPVKWVLSVDEVNPHTLNPVTQEKSNEENS